MPAKAKDILTAHEAAEWIESLPPVEIKNRLLDYLRWQASHGKILLHSAHYFRVIKYGYKPRESTVQRNMSSIQHLIKGIGG